MPKFPEYRGTRLPASAISTVIYGNEIIELYVGRIQIVRVLMLSTKWENAIRATYADHGRAIRMNRETLGASQISEIVQQQVDANRRWWTYGVLTHKKRNAYLVPFNEYWLGVVEGEGQ